MRRLRPVTVRMVVELHGLILGQACLVAVEVAASMFIYRLRPLVEIDERALLFLVVVVLLRHQELGQLLLFLVSTRLG